MSNEFEKVTDVSGKRIWYNDAYTDETAYNSICTAKTRLLLRHAFWGFMGLDLVLIETPTETIKTLATDGYHIFYAPQFINQLTIDECEFVIAHEIYHCIFGHTSGKGKVQRMCEDWDSRRWNRACDFVINYDLVESNIGSTTIKDDKHHIGDIQICYDEKYEGMSAEEVYFALCETDDDDSQTIDVHIDIEIGSQDGQEAQAKVNADGSITITMDAAQYAEEKLRWKDTAEQAVANAKMSPQGAGSLPSNLLRLIGDLHKPVILWPTVLRNFVINVNATGYNWSSPSKFSTGRISLPSFRKQSEKLEIAVAIDTSGSVGTDALTKFISELFAILQTYQQYTIHAFCFEGDVDQSTYMKIESYDASAKQNLKKYVAKITGGGGTMFQSIWDFMKSKKLKPRGLLVFTDGYPCDDGWSNERNYCPALFVTVGNTNQWKAPFGHTIAYESM